jgi:hypothetical protein
MAVEVAPRDYLIPHGVREGLILGDHYPLIGAQFPTIL